MSFLRRRQRPSPKTSFDQKAQDYGTRCCQGVITLMTAPTSFVTLGHANTHETRDARISAVLFNWHYTSWTAGAIAENRRNCKFASEALGEVFLQLTNGRHCASIRNTDDATSCTLSRGASNCRWLRTIEFRLYGNRYHQRARS